MASIEIRTNAGAGIGEAVSRLLRVQSLAEPTPEDMLELGNIVWEANQDRTARGVGADGQQFDEYSRNYAKYKAKHGGSTAVVDLMGVGRGDGHMLVEMEVWESAKDEVKIGFKDKASLAARKALGHIRGVVAKNLPVRRFLGLTADDRAAVIARRVEQIEDKLKGF